MNQTALTSYSGRLEELLGLLRQEHAALTGRDSAALEQCTDAKHLLLAELEKQSVGNDEINSLDPVLKERIKSLLEQCRQQNRVNGVMIDASRRLNDRMLQIMLGSTSGSFVYDAAGKNSTRLPTQTITRA